VRGGIASMGDRSSSDSVETVARPQLPPFAALHECLELQTAAPPRSPVARLFGLDPLARGALRSYRGAMAELFVVDVLSTMGEGWTVLHSVPMGPDAADLDHLLIGPPGVLVISVASHAEQKVWVGERIFMADDVRHPYLPFAEHRNRAVAARLAADDRASVTVTSCIVVADPGELTVTRTVRQIEIMASRDFERWLRNLPRLLSPGLVSVLAAEAAAWPAVTDADRDTDRALLAFDALRRCVRRAFLLRIGWIAVGTLLCYGALYRGAAMLLGAAS
jgi:hypothetical protein